MKRPNSNSPFHTYPGGGTVRSLSLSMRRDLAQILQSVRDQEDVPPWVLMKLSQAANAIEGVANYTSYYGMNRNK